MDYDNGLLGPDRWDWIADHAGPFFTILTAAVALAATVVWFVLWAYFRRTINDQRRKLKEFESKLGGSTPDETRRLIDSLRARLARLEPRHLTGRQKATLKKLLTLPEPAGVTEINVSHDAACGDSRQYADEFIHVFRACSRWKPFSVTMFGSGPRPEAGLAIVCFKQGRTAAGAKLLSKAFHEAGIDHETIHSTEEQLELVITSRPST